jgi:hypothetical protein
MFYLLCKKAWVEDVFSKNRKILGLKTKSGRQLIQEKHK